THRPAPDEEGHLEQDKAAHQQHPPEGVVEPAVAGLVEERQRLRLEEVGQREDGEAKEVDQQQRAEDEPLAGTAKRLGARWSELPLGAPGPEVGHDDDAGGDDKTHRRLVRLGYMDHRCGEGEVEKADRAAQYHCVATAGPEVEASDEQAKGEAKDEGADDIA